jgi:hypothetical protein
LLIGQSFSLRASLYWKVLVVVCRKTVKKNSHSVTHRAHGQPFLLMTLLPHNLNGYPRARPLLFCGYVHDRIGLGIIIKHYLLVSFLWGMTNRCSVRAKSALWQLSEQRSVGIKY